MIPSNVGDTVVRVRNSISHATALLRLEVKQCEEFPTLFVVIRGQTSLVDESRVNFPPPYRIHNLTVMQLGLRQEGTAERPEVSCIASL